MFNPLKFDNMENFVPASPRQLWALYCITKNDYRDKNLSRDEAARLIKELGNPDYKKKSTTKSPTSIKDELLKYITDNFKEISKDVTETLKARSIISVEGGGDKRNFHFVGFGCGFVWLEYDKRSKLGKEIEKAAKELHRKEVLQLFLKGFTKKERTYYDNIGCPLEAIWQQDMNIKESYYYLVSKFGLEKGVKKMSYNSRLD